MIPIRDCEHPLLVVLALVRRVGIIDNQWSTKAIGVLRCLMGVIPVRARLVNLPESQYLDSY